MHDNLSSIRINNNKEFKWTAEYGFEGDYSKHKKRKLVIKSVP